MNASTSEKRRWGRRLGCAAFAIGNVDVLIVLGCLGKIPWEWSYKFSGLIVAVALIVSGVLTATDAIALWRKP